MCPMKVNIPEKITVNNDLKNDLDLLSQLKSYPDHELALTAGKIIRCHLWYVSPALVGLAFFDEHLSWNIKLQMAEHLKHPFTGNECNRLQGKDTALDKPLEEFVSSKTQVFFDAVLHGTGKYPKFLQKHPEQWNDDETFQAALQCVRSIRVVNDTAERGIALAKRFTSAIMKQEDQKQFLLYLVHHVTKEVPKKPKLK